MTCILEDADIQVFSKKLIEKYETRYFSCEDRITAKLLVYARFLGADLVILKRLFIERIRTRKDKVDAHYSRLNAQKKLIGVI